MLIKTLDKIKRVLGADALLLGVHGNKLDVIVLKQVDGGAVHQKTHFALDALRDAGDKAAVDFILRGFEEFVDCREVHHG